MVTEVPGCFYTLHVSDQLVWSLHNCLLAVFLC